jgi:hypothetical protein
MSDEIAVTDAMRMRRKSGDKKTGRRNCRMPVLHATAQTRFATLFAGCFCDVAERLENDSKPIIFNGGNECLESATSAVTELASYLIYTSS